MSENIISNGEEYGSVQISEDVVSVIAGIAATEIPGVAGMSGGFTGGITEMLGMTNLSKGVKVEIGTEEVAVDTYLVVDYGENIVAISKKVQDNVKKSIETMTGLEVVEVNVNVQGVHIKKEKEKNTEEDSRLK